jgi:hypothetical protein
MLDERWRGALRSRLVGGGFKLPSAASANSRGGERDGQKACGNTSSVGWRDERKRTSEDASKQNNLMAPKPGSALNPGSSVAATYLLATRCPVWRRRDSNPGSCPELANLAGDAKGKGSSGGPARPKVLMRPPGADCSVVALKRGNARGAKGAGHSHRTVWPTGNGRSWTVSAEGGSLLWVARAV